MNKWDENIPRPLIGETVPIDESGSSSGFEVTPTRSPETRSMGDVYLISALVELPGKIGHRAMARAFNSKEEAIGTALEIWQVDGWSVSSYDCKHCFSLRALAQASEGGQS